MNLRRYLVVWALLLALTALTFGVAHLSLGALNTPIAFAIALGKASLIALVFMHLSSEGFTLRFVLVGAVLFLALLVGMVLVDGSTRYPLAAPPGSRRFDEPLAGQLG